MTFDGHSYYAVFQVGRSGDEGLSFLRPPKVAGETLRDRQISPPGNLPLYVTLEVAGGLLEVSPLEFAPAKLQAGKLVKFARPRVTFPGGRVADKKYSWRFGDGGFSEAPSPTHSFQADRYPYTIEVAVTVTGTVFDKGVRAFETGEQRRSVSVTSGEPPKSHGPGGGEQEGSQGGSPSVNGPKPGSAGGSPTGKAHTPATAVQSPHKTITPHRPGLSSGAGSGGSGNGSSVKAHDGPAKGPGAISRGASGAHSQHTTEKRQRTGTPAGLVGVLLEPDGGKLPTALFAGDASPSDPASALPSDATPGSSGDGGPGGPLGWVAGILVILIVVVVGVLVELQPGAPYRRLTVE
jgi:hypothetical protein